jgi:hypothetical protein
VGAIRSPAGGFGQCVLLSSAFSRWVQEILAPSRNHERGKTQIGNLLELYFLATDTEYFPMGSTTLKKPERQAGVKGVFRILWDRHPACPS